MLINNTKSSSFVVEGKQILTVSTLLSLKTLLSLYDTLFENIFYTNCS